MKMLKMIPVFAVGLLVLSLCGPANVLGKPPKGRTTVSPKKPKIPHARSGQDPSFRIIGGEKAEPAHWIWQAQVVCGGNSFAGSSSFAGGSLIHKQWVVTAASVIYNYNPVTDCQVILGKYTFDYETGEQTFPIIEVIPSKEYEGSNVKGGDIALLKLGRCAELSNSIGLIELPLSGVPITTSSKCYATGWGLNNFTAGTNPTELKEIEVPISTASNAQYCKPLITPRATMKGIICGGDEKKTHQEQINVCFGDEGGPLHCLDPDDKYRLYGVLSVYPPQCTPFMAVFTKVQKFEDWITETISDSPCK